jgi:FtsP/CotA-like multicopper oxidase with cupredoxin domain
MSDGSGNFSLASNAAVGSDPIPNGTAPSSATTASGLHRTNASIWSSRKCPGGHEGYNRWTINGKSWPAANPLFTTQTGKRHRIAMTNKRGDNHPVQLHRHSFEISWWAKRPRRA